MATLGQLGQMVQNIRNRDTMRTFLEDKDIAQYDKIMIYQIGGAGGFGRVASAMFSRYPALLSKFQYCMVDFVIDPNDVRPEFDVINMGGAVDGSVREVLSRLPIPDDFSTEERQTIEDFKRRNGHHTFTYGAGACAPIGRLGYRACRKDVGEFLYDSLYDFQTRHNVRKILPLVIGGSGGGTANGVVNDFRQQLQGTAKTMGLLGTGGIITVWTAWLAYQRILFSGAGSPTEMAPLLFKKGNEKWADESGAYFLASEIGPDGLLAMILTIAKTIAILNNAHEIEAYPNGIILAREITPWLLQRAAAFVIQRGVAPKESHRMWSLQRQGLRKQYEAKLEMNVAALSTVRDFAEAQYLLDRERVMAALVDEMTSKGIEREQVVNMASVDLLVDAQMALVRNTINALQWKSGATGSFLMPHEAKILDMLMSQTVRSVLDGTATVVVPQPEDIPTMVDGKVYSDQSFRFGSADMRFTLGKLESSDAPAKIITPSYVPLSREEARKLRRDEILAEADMWVRSQQK